jgi:hypothetical protein
VNLISQFEHNAQVSARTAYIEDRTAAGSHHSICCNTSLTVSTVPWAGQEALWAWSKWASEVIQSPRHESDKTTAPWR